MNKARGVRWEYFGTHRPSSLEHPDAQRCQECERWFVATEYRGDGDGYYCPECKPVESLSHSFENAIDEADEYGLPEFVTVSDLTESETQ